MRSDLSFGSKVSLAPTANASPPGLCAIQGLQGIPASCQMLSFGDACDSKHFCVWLSKHDACSTSDGLLNELCFGVVFAGLLPYNPPLEKGQGDFPLQACELAGQAFSSETHLSSMCGFPYTCRSDGVPPYPWIALEPKQSGNRSRCNTLDFLAKVVWQAFPLHPLWAALTHRKDR